MKRQRGAVNVTFAFISIVIAIILWFIVFPAHLIATKQPFQIQLTRNNLPSDYVLEEFPQDVTVYAKVTDQERSDFITKMPHAEVDLSQPKTGPADYRVSIYPFDLRSRVLEGNPSPTVHLTIYKKSNIPMPVTIDSSNSVSDPSLQVNDLVVEPKIVRIIGPEPDVDKVTSVRGTLVLNPDNPQLPVEIDLKPFDKQNNLVANVEPTPDRVSVTPKLGLKPSTKTVGVQPKFTGQVPEGYTVKGVTVTPNVITAMGSTMALKAVDGVQTQIIDVSQLTSSQVLTVQLIEPRNVKLSKREVKVTIQIEPVSVRSLNPNASGAKPPSTGSTAGSTSGSPGQGL